jgi:hypothetical protein
MPPFNIWGSNLAHRLIVARTNEIEVRGVFNKGLGDTVCVHDQAIAALLKGAREVLPGKECSGQQERIRYPYCRKLGDLFGRTRVPEQDR